VGGGGSALPREMSPSVVKKVCEEEPSLKGPSHQIRNARKVISIKSPRLGPFPLDKKKLLSHYFLAGL
jgi:hypothetical protein